MIAGELGRTSISTIVSLVCSPVIGTEVTDPSELSSNRLMLDPLVAYTSAALAAVDDVATAPESKPSRNRFRISPSHLVKRREVTNPEPSAASSQRYFMSTSF